MFSNRLDGLFHQALDAIDAGDVAALERVLRDHPELVQKRLTRSGKWLKDQMGGSIPRVMKDPYSKDDAVRLQRYQAIAAHLAGKGSRDD
ncbi:MAG TPA: hypothetical protein VFV78_04245 [Vicinamibacterales bacterium]|nr:hypothetical protein [Vicinamibacterales bacterium]